MASVILPQLDRFGPERCEALDLAAARGYVRELATGHYENFTVVSKLLPANLREHFAAVYAFCRWADDLGDEVAPGDPRKSLDLLAWWRRELDDCYAGKPRHPVFVALGPTIEKFDVPVQPFGDLIGAFEQDQRVRRYQTWEQVLDYCTRSADPVGRLVLYLCGYRDAERQRYSDRTCTALQLTNFWQDVRRDIIERDRIYVPADILAKHGATHEDMVACVLRPAACVGDVSRRTQAASRTALKECCDRTWPLFEEGRKLWPMVRPEVRLSIRLFSLGGQRVLRLVEKTGYDTLNHRPKLSKAGKLWLMAGAMVNRWFAKGSAE